MTCAVVSWSLIRAAWLRQRCRLAPCSFSKRLYRPRSTTATLRLWNRDQTHRYDRTKRDGLLSTYSYDIRNLQTDTALILTLTGSSISRCNPDCKQHIRPWSDIQQGRYGFQQSSKCPQLQLYYVACISCSLFFWSPVQVQRRSELTDKCFGKRPEASCSGKTECACTAWFSLVSSPARRSTSLAQERYW